MSLRVVLPAAPPLIPRAAGWALLAGILLAAATCGGCAGRLYDQVPLAGGGQVYVGMTSWELTTMLGPPQHVGRGSWGCKFSANFLDITPGSKTVEYAWYRASGILVAWLDNGAVSFLGHIPREVR